MKYWLVVFILLNGEWTPGAKVKPMGWHPRAYDSLETCQKRKAFAIEAVRKTAKAPSRWFCTTRPDAPLEELEREAKGKSSSQ